MRCIKINNHSSSIDFHAQGEIHNMIAFIVHSHRLGTYYWTEWVVLHQSSFELQLEKLHQSNTSIALHTCKQTLSSRELKLRSLAEQLTTPAYSNNDFLGGDVLETLDLIYIRLQTHTHQTFFWWKGITCYKLTYTCANEFKAWLSDVHRYMEYVSRQTHCDNMNTWKWLSVKAHQLGLFSHTGNL